MPRRTAWPALASLSRRFAAEFRGDQLAEKFPAGSARELFRRGILVDAGFASSLGTCVCELQHGECDVRVDVHDGVPWGYCNEYGKPVELSPERLQRYRFDWKKWASWLRLRNRLGGDGPALGAGVVFVGSGAVGGREFGLLVVAPGCRRAGDVVLPEGARRADRALVALVLGEPVQDLGVGAAVPLTALGEDFGTIDETAIERALGAVPVTVPQGDLHHVIYCRESPRGKRIDEAEHRRLSRPEVRDGFDLFIDRPACAVWRKGRRHEKVLDAQGRARKKRLGPTSVGLLADYVSRPHRSMTAKETPTYRTSPTDARSATAQLGEVRRSVRAQDFIRPGARSSKYGELPYVFDPGGMSWCLIDRPRA